MALLLQEIDRCQITPRRGGLRLESFVALSGGGVCASSDLLHRLFLYKRAGEKSVEEEQREGSEDRCEESLEADRVNPGIAPEEDDHAAANHAATDARQHRRYGAAWISTRHDRLRCETSERPKPHPAQQFIHAGSEDFDKFCFCHGRASCPNKGGMPLTQWNLPIRAVNHKHVAGFVRIRTLGNSDEFRYGFAQQCDV